MAKHKSEDAFNARMIQLANIGGTSQLKESRSLGTLIDVKRTADGVAYGIVKENHQYYIKKGGLKENLGVEDFAYIGGLSNITEHQYPSLSTADKNRNFLLSTINESLSTKVSKTGSKKVILNEDKAEKEIDAAAEKVDDLEVATDAAAVADVPEPAPEDNGEEEMAAGIEDMPADDGEVSADEPAPEGGEDMPPMDGEEAPEGGEDMPPMDGEEAPEGGEDMPPMDGEEAPEDGEAPEGDEENTGMGNVSDELAKNVGQAADEIRKADLDVKGLNWILSTFLSSFQPSSEEGDHKLRELGDSERHEYADMILKVTSDKEQEDLPDSVPQDGEEEMEESQCDECGTFAKYAESRGYDAESIMECGDEEMTNIISGYANAHGEEQNDGDFKAVALFITPEIIEKLKSEYGQDEFAGQVEPFSTEMNEEDRTAQIAELFGGLKNLGKAAGQGIKKGAQQVGQAIGDKAQQVGQGVQQAATNVKQTYHAGELGPEVKKLEKAAANLGSQVDSLNKRMQKAGGQPMNIKSILSTIQNQVSGAKGVDLSRYSSVQEEGPDVPTDSLEVQPNLDLEEDVNIKVVEKEGKKLSPDNTPEVEMKEGQDKMGVGFQPMGAAVVKPESGKAEPVTEAEIKLRKYIRNRLEEKAGKRKPSLNENKKSATLQKLDKVIDKQLGLFENVTMNEIMGLSMREKIGKLNPQDPAAVEDTFYKVFMDILNNPKIGGAIARAAKTTPTETKYDILKQYADNNGGTLRLTDRDTIRYAGKDEKDAATRSAFSMGGTQGRTNYGGTAG